MERSRTRWTFTSSHCFTLLRSFLLLTLSVRTAPILLFIRSAGFCSILPLLLSFSLSFSLIGAFSTPLNSPSSPELAVYFEERRSCRQQYNIRLAHYTEIDRSINSTRRIWAEYARLFYAIFAGTMTRPAVISAASVACRQRLEIPFSRTESVIVNR